jgi:uncharacterized protein
LNWVDQVGITKEPIPHKEVNLMADAVAADAATAGLLSDQGGSYCLLTSFRRSGEGVGTPVWFAIENGTVYVKTGVDSGKVKRIRANPSVRLTPCTLRGRLRGPAAAGTARVVTDPSEEARAEQALAGKYGISRPVVLAFMRWRGVRETYVAIEPYGSGAGERHAG